ncbi:unnamed protein product, partial [Schistocephalus solidus]|uniref:Granulin b n=1 Tax=Schistocephalus solidus TaxID=70667 RepID=A0A183T9H1_SCHSO
AGIVSSTTPVVPSPSKACDSQETPCTFKPGGVACCPFENAVCCNDSLHCCPAGYQCDAHTQSCIITDDSHLGLDFHRKETRKDDNICPADEDLCDEWQTCCKMVDGRPGCCPMANAQCCSDGVHCCPEGTRCNALSNACIPTNRVNPFRLPSTTTSPRLSNRTTIALVPSRSSDSVCPDGKSSCSREDTCCLMADNNYGCCPSENAVCCADGRHCCPSGYTCDNEAGTCVSSSMAQPLLRTDNASATSEMQLATFVSASPALVDGNKCDDSYSCDDNATCCRMEDGNWGCCPLVRVCAKVGEYLAAGIDPCTLTIKMDSPEQFSLYADVSESLATCCDDKKHCCPEGYECYWHICKKKSPWANGPAFLPMKEKKPALPSGHNRAAFVPCPDGHSKCPDGSTCCPAGDKQQYGCCPLPNGQCCVDGRHCCPSGYNCGKDACVLDLGGALPWDLARKSQPRADELHVCPDQVTVCLGSQNCCQGDAAESWKCCP